MATQRWQYSFHEFVHIRIHEILQTFRNQLERLSKTFDSTTNRKAFSWCLLSLSNPKTSLTFLNSSSAIFPTRCVKSTQKLALCFFEYARWITNSWRHGNFFSARFCRRFFSAGETIVEKTGCSRRLFVTQSLRQKRTLGKLTIGLSFITCYI